MTVKSLAELIVVSGIAVAATLIAVASDHRISGCTTETWPLHHVAVTITEVTGAELTATNDGVVVSYVRCGGPAAQMGLRQGDLLVKMDDSPATSTSTLKFLNFLFARSPKKVAHEVTLSRGDRTLRLSVPPDLVPLPPNASGFGFGPRSGPMPVPSPAK
ncbi:MAG: PDZ domain-containing protein [Chloroflexi bacterium]|nr:PDZ domain-containing protein [Chloroflexota bacterium]